MLSFGRLLVTLFVVSFAACVSFAVAIAWRNNHYGCYRRWATRQRGRWIRVIANGATISLIDGRMKVPAGRSDRLYRHWWNCRMLGFIGYRQRAAFGLLLSSSDVVFFFSSFSWFFSLRDNIIHAAARLILLLLPKAVDGTAVFVRAIVYGSPLMEITYLWNWREKYCIDCNWMWINLFWTCSISFWRYWCVVTFFYYINSIIL